MKKYFKLHENRIWIDQAAWVKHKQNNKIKDNTEQTFESC